MIKRPRGIQRIERTTAEGTLSIRYRVRITRKDFVGKRDNYFDDLEEAIEFLNLSKTTKGKELIYKITEEERVRNLAKTINGGWTQNNFTFGYYLDLYLQEYVLRIKPTTELEKRNQNNTLSFYKTIRNTKILYRHLTFEQREQFNIDDDRPIYVKIEELDIREFKSIEINYYIRERLKSIKPISVSREITKISNVFSKLQYLNEDLAEIQNPCLNYDKDLLKGQIVKRDYVLNDDDEKRLFSALFNYSNPEVFNICKLSLLTSLRRSEVITLRPEQVKDNYILLDKTKNRKSRRVYLDKTAIEFISSLKPYSQGKFFKFTIGGFENAFKKVRAQVNLNHILFKDLRKTKISKVISQIGAENSIFVAEFLGIKSVRKLEENHISDVPNFKATQQQALKSFGHSSPQVTIGHYFSFQFPKKKENRIDELKRKRKDKTITLDEEKELLNLLLDE